MCLRIVDGTEKRWQFALQAGVGLPVLPAAIQGWRGKDKVVRGRAQEPGFMAGPQSLKDLDDWNYATASGFDMGTLYTMIAGLLNFLVIFDAFAGPLPPPVAKPAKKRAPQSKDSKSSEASAKT